MPTVYYDPGHGGQDSGAVGTLLEKDINLDVALKAKAKTEALGIKVIICRTSDVFVDLNARWQEANNDKADLFVSIHHNGGEGYGYEVYHSVVGGKGEDFANLLASEYSALGMQPHGEAVKTRPGADGDYYAVIKYSNMPAVLSEYCFVDDSDIQHIDEDVERDREAQAITNAVAKFFAVSNIPQPVYQAPAPQPPAGKFYTGGVPIWQVRRGDQNGAVNLLQQLLNMKGYGLQVDGDFGGNTETAVRDFQASVGIGVDGVAGPQTWSYLLPNVVNGSTGLAVTILQQILDAKFGYNLDPDGSAGTLTCAAIGDYQSKHGLGVDDDAGPNTWYSMLAA